ncbi:thermonuclease family protein [Planctomycetota bacterium]
MAQNSLRSPAPQGNDVPRWVHSAAKENNGKTHHLGTVKTEAAKRSRTLTRVRVVGIDCPEFDKPFGNEGKQLTMAFCLRKNVELIGEEVDRDGRRLADVIVDGKSLRDALLTAGLAWHDC